MLLNTLRILLIVPIIGLSIGACSQQADEGASVTADVGEAMGNGQGVYLANCAACHLPTGVGLAGAFPPLAGSDFLQGNRREVLAAALFGLRGPITVNGVEYNGVMPSFGHLRDEELAAAISYVFASWGNDLPAVSVEEVAALRAELGQTELNK